MQKIKKTLKALWVMLGIALIFTVGASAADYGYAHVKEFVDTSAYADITFENGWVQVATDSSTKLKDADSDGLYVGEGDLQYGSNYRAYFNEDTLTLVIEGVSRYSQPTAGYSDRQSPEKFPYWCTQNADKVKYIEFRQCQGFNNTSYIIRPLSNVEEIKLDTSIEEYNGAKYDSAVFAGLSSLMTVGWGSWNVTTGAWVPSADYYHKGVVDLRGFTYLSPMGTSSDVPELIMYMGGGIYQSASVREVILPLSPLPSENKTYNVMEKSDGSDAFPSYDGTGNIPAGTNAYKLINSDGKIAYSKTFSLPTGWSRVTANTADIKPYNGDFSGMIPYQFAEGAASLQTVTVPEGVILHRIYKNAFKNCGALREIRIDGVVAEDFVIDAGAFGTGNSLVSGVDIIVTSDECAQRVIAALSAAGYTDSSAVRVTRKLINPITADGFQIKLDKEYNGLRGLFSFDETSKTENKDLGYTFVEYGVVVCSKTVALAYDSNRAIMESEDERIIRKVVENVSGTGEYRFVDYANRQFCVAITHISSKYSDNDVYFFGYSIWKDENEELRYVYTSYTSSDKDDFVNLYETTMGLFANGLVNSETVRKAGGNADTIIWEPLRVGAVTLTSDQFAPPGTPKNTSTKATYTLTVDAKYNTDGSFTYLDCPLYGFTGATSGNYSFNPSGVEEKATTNILWSLYKYGDKYVAVYRRDPSAASTASAVLPTQTVNGNGGVHPFREGYGALSNNNVSGNVTIHSPVLTADDAKKVNTVILDYGIDTTEGEGKQWNYNGSFALANLPYTETVVYPNGFAPYSDSESLFRNDSALKNVIWANKPAENLSHKYHMGDVVVPIGGEEITSLADLRGMGPIDAEAAFMYSGLENIVFSGFAKDAFTQTFASASSLIRVWISGPGSITLPEKKTIDLSLDTVVTRINRQAFGNVGSEGYTIKLSNAVKAVVPFEGSYADAFATTFGARLIPVSIEAPNPAFEASFYDYLVSLKDTSYRISPQNVTVNGKSYKDIREQVCFKESELVIYPELDARINRNFDYKVSVHQGENSGILPVYNHTMFNAPHNRSVGGDSYRRYSMFAFCGDKVRVDIKVGFDFSRYSIIPSAKNFETSFDPSTGTVSVYLDKPDYFGVRFDDDDNTIISIFADLPEYPDEKLTQASGDTIYIEDWYSPAAGDGITETTDGHKGTLYITSAKNNQTLYIAPGAVLYGRVKFYKTVNCSVIGRGVVVDPFEDSRMLDIRDGGTEGGGNYTSKYKSQLMNIENSTDFFYDGPVLMDARCFNLTSSGSNIHIKNYKVMSSMMTTDGITDGAKNSRYEHCWIYCGDNCLVVSGSTNSYYKDIALGTTCASVFPQSNVRNATLENIYVFRANDGIINHRYNPRGDDLVATMVFKNFDCMDTVNYPQFFGGANMGASVDKVFTFENLALPTASNVTDPHASAILNGASRAGARLVEVTRSNSEDNKQIDTLNYTFNFINTYVNGEIIDSRDKAIISEYTDTQGTNTYSFSVSDNGYTPVQKVEYYVNYTAPGKVYIGSLLVSFEGDVIIEEDTFYLPADEMSVKLRTSARPATVTRNGIEYVAHTELVAGGAALSATVTDGNLTVIPVPPAADENIVIQNRGLVTREFETTCYHIDLVQNRGDGVMYAYPHSNQYNGGIGYNITEEVKMYGAGIYTLKLMARCVPLEGGEYSKYVLKLQYDDANAYYDKNPATGDTSRPSNVSAVQTLTGDWVEYTLEVAVTDEMVRSGKGFAFLATATGNIAVDHYEVKDMIVTFRQN